MTSEESLKLSKLVQKDWKWFIKDILNTRLYSKTREIIDAVQNNDQVAISSCYSSGKSYILSRVALAFLFAHPGESTVITTSTGGRQVRAQLWRYLHEAVEGAQIPLGGQLLQTEYRLGKSWWAQGFTSRRGESIPLHGFHNKHQMVIFDEASGLEPSTWYALDNMMAGGNVKVVASGNPTSVDTPFYQCFTKDAKYWNRIFISAFDVPNVRLKSDSDPRAIPGLTSWRWVRQMMQKYTINDPIFQIKVLGQFPDKSEFSLIQPLWVEWARDEPPAFDAASPVVAGLDVAYTGGDETVLCVRVDTRIIKIVGIRDDHPLQAVKLVHQELGGIRASGRLKQINIDATGGGIAIAAMLEEQGWPINRVIATAKPTVLEDRYQNLRAQLWFNLRDVFRERRVGGDISEEIENQLAAVRYEINLAGKQQIEDKRDFRKRMGYSPDYADAIMYAFADAVTSGIIPIELSGFGEASYAPRIVHSQPGLVVVKNRGGFFDDDDSNVYYGEYSGDSDDSMVDQWLNEQDDILEPPKIRTSGLLRGNFRNR